MRYSEAELWEELPCPGFPDSTKDKGTLGSGMEPMRRPIMVKSQVPRAMNSHSVQTLGTLWLLVGPRHFL